MKDIVDGFNHFFVDVGPDLAKETKGTGKIAEEVARGERNSNSISLETVDRREIIEIVRNSANKISTDGVDKKNVIVGIVDPISHICNLSFASGECPEKVKLA